VWSSAIFFSDVVDSIIFSMTGVRLIAQSYPGNFVSVPEGLFLFPGFKLFLKLSSTYWDLVSSFVTLGASYTDI